MIKKLITVFNYILYIIFWFIILDFLILRFCLNIGYPRDITLNKSFAPYPYTSFIFRHVAESDKYNTLYDSEKSLFKGMKDDDLKVAFFAGSTGLVGFPSLSELIEKNLEEKLNMNVFLVNFSMFCGQARQHMHMLLEFTDKHKEIFKPDIVIFYNGFNEINQPWYFDPRPGYPYNFYYLESPEWKKFLIKYSAVFGLIEWHNATLTPLNKLRNQINFRSPEWKQELLNNYFGTYELSKEIVDNMPSQYFGKSQFFGFFQPFRYYDKELEELNLQIEQKINNYDYIFNVHHSYDELDENIWSDECHVSGQAHVIMAEEIANIIYEKLKEKKFINNLEKNNLYRLRHLIKLKI